MELKNKIVTETRSAKPGVAETPFRSAYGEKLRVKSFTDLPSVAKQSFKKECDINNILRNYKRTGVVTHINPQSPVYTWVPPVDLQQAIQQVETAKMAFETLPAQVRESFDNDPAAFLRAVENPDNYQQLADLGLSIEGFEPQAAPASPLGETPSEAPSEPVSEDDPPIG